MRGLIVCLAALCGLVTATAQVRVDAGAALTFPTAQASFRTLPGFPSCCPEYTSGSGVGGSFGIGVDVPVWRSLFASVRLSRFDRSHALTSQEYADVIVGNDLTQATIEHVIDAPLTEIGVETHLGARLGSIVLRGGIGHAWRTFGTVNSREELLSPSGAVFTDTRTTTRNARSGPMPEAITQTWYGTIVMGYEIALDRARSWRITPEAAFTFASADVTGAVPWKIVVPSFGIRLSFGLATTSDNVQPPPAPQQPTSTVSVVPVAPPPTTIDTHALVVRADVGNGIRIEETEEERFLPVLPYVFFERRSASLPERYVTSMTTGSINASTTSVSFHRHLLAVIAARMRSNERAMLTLTGTCAADENDTALSMRRARAVRSILVDSFGIAPRRIALRARLLPEQVSKAAGQEGPYADDENRRVELTTTDPAILDPYRVADTTLVMTPPNVVITTKTSDNVPIDHWQVHVNDSAIAASNEKLKDAVVFTPDAEQIAALIREGRLRVSVNGRHRGVSVADSVEVAITTIRLSDKRRERMNDSIIERFELVVFPFRRSEITDAHRRILGLVRARIGSDARVIVEGCTDIIGNTDENLRISAERANAVADLVSGRVTIIARGEPTLNTPQVLPEERMLQRVVRITAIVPIGAADMRQQR